MAIPENASGHSYLTFFGHEDDDDELPAVIVLLPGTALVGAVGDGFTYGPVMGLAEVIEPVARGAAKGTDGVIGGTVKRPGAGVAAINRRVYAASDGRNRRAVGEREPGGLPTGVGEHSEAVGQLR